MFKIVESATRIKFLTPFYKHILTLPLPDILSRFLRERRGYVGAI